MGGWVGPKANHLVPVAKQMTVRGSVGCASLVWPPDGMGRVGGAGGAVRHVTCSPEGTPAPGHPPGTGECRTAAYQRGRGSYAPVVCRRRRLDPPLRRRSASHVARGFRLERLRHSTSGCCPCLGLHLGPCPCLYSATGYFPRLCLHLPAGRFFWWISFPLYFLVKKCRPPTAVGHPPTAVSYRWLPSNCRRSPSNRRRYVTLQPPSVTLQLPLVTVGTLRLPSVTFQLPVGYPPTVAGYPLAAADYFNCPPTAIGSFQCRPIVCLNTELATGWPELLFVSIRKLFCLPGLCPYGHSPPRPIPLFPETHANQRCRQRHRHAVRIAGWRGHPGQGCA